MADVRVCVTGASGYVGSHVTRELLARGYRVRATVRDPDDPRRVDHLLRAAAILGARERLEFAAVDVLDRGSLERALRGCRDLCHVAAVAKLWAADPRREIVEPAVTGTRNALEVAAEVGVERVVLTSSVAAIVDERIADKVSYDEGDWNHERDIERTPYTVSKSLAEREAWTVQRRLAPARRFSMVAINPSVILGPVLAADHTRTTPAIARDLMTGNMPGLPNMCLSVVDVRDVAQAHAVALERRRLDGRFIVCNRPLWLAELAEEIRRRRPGRPIPRRRVPDWLMYAAAVFDRRVNWAFLRRNLGVERRLDNGRSRRLLGLRYRPIGETVRDMIASFEHHGVV